MEESEVYVMDLKALYNAFLAMTVDENPYLQETKQVKEGFKLKVPIQYIIKGYYTEYPDSKRVSIMGFGKHDLTDFHNELEKRESILRKVLIEMLTSNQIAVSR